MPRSSKKSRFSWFEWCQDAGLKIFEPRPIKNIQAFNTPAGIYYGETHKDEMNGLGFLFYDSGDCYFGEFESNEKHGEGIMIFCCGTILRGFFDQGMVTGYSLLRCPGNIVLIMSFTEGYLQGPTTYVNELRKEVRAMMYSEGEYVETVKSFSNGTEDFVRKLFFKIFPLDEEEINENLKITEQISNKYIELEEIVYLGTFFLKNLGVYYGIMKSGQPYGYGILIDENFKIKIGYFKDECINGHSRIIEKSG